MRFSVLSRVVVTLVSWLLAVGAAGDEKPVVVVGGYIYPPYVMLSEDGRYTGATLDLIELLNEIQSEYRFEFVPIAAFTRQRSFRQGRYDAIFFESSHWQWQVEAITFTPPVTFDRDLYVSLAKPDRDQGFFNNIRNYRIIAKRGYHYGFAGYETDDSQLQQRFNISFSPSLESSIDMLERDRGDVAILNESFIRFLNRSGRMDEAFLISERADHSYELGIGLGDTAAVDVEWMTQHLAQLKPDHHLEGLARRWGLILVEDF